MGRWLTGARRKQGQRALVWAAWQAAANCQSALEFLHFRLHAVMIKVCIRAWLQPCRTDAKGVGLQPLVMARPAHNALPDNILSSARTFFATTKTSQGRALLQPERNATLMIDVLRSYVTARKFIKHWEYIAGTR